MGVIVRQDWAYTINVVLKLVDIFEGQWQDQDLDMPVKDISACMFLIVCCLGGTRGFEAVWTDLGALRYNVAFCEAAEEETALS